MVKWNYSIREIEEKNKDWSTVMKYCEIYKWRMPTYRGSHKYDEKGQIVQLESPIYSVVCVYMNEFRNFKHTFQALRELEFYGEFKDFLRFICEHGAVGCVFENENINIEFKPSTMAHYVLNIKFKKTREEIRKSK